MGEKRSGECAPPPLQKKKKSNLPSYQKTKSGEASTLLFKIMDNTNTLGVSPQNYGGSQIETKFYSRLIMRTVKIFKAYKLKSYEVNLMIFTLSLEKYDC